MTMTAEIALTQGQVAIVDAADFEWLSQWKWQPVIRAGGNCYVSRMFQQDDGTRVRISMHRLIMGATKGQVVDHIDHNPLNNTRANLRICTHAENRRNRKPNVNGASKYLGVYWLKSHRKWRAQIRVDKRIKHLGLFACETAAAKAYDAAARTYHGEFANPNFGDGA